MTHELYLQKALDLAETRRGFCSPNPAVGAVLVHNDQIIAEGCHFAAGQPHAEAALLNTIKNIPEKSRLYVTLEPCCHFGRTPPCTDAIIKAGIKEVFYGYADPNPIVAGKGQKILEQVGILCRHIPIESINAFYKSYTYWQQTKKPWVTAKLAMTLDGKIAKSCGSPVAITSHHLSNYTHQYRKKSDALLTTAKTIIKDDPQLNVRAENEVIAKAIYIIDSQLATPLNARIFKTAKKVTIFHDETVSCDKITTFQNKGAQCICVSGAQQLKLTEIITRIGQEGVHDLWIEAGAQLFSSLLTQKLIHQAIIYIAPWMMGEGLNVFSESFDFREHRVEWEWVGKEAVLRVDFG